MPRNCSVPSQLRVKMHSKSPSVMAFCLVCLGILAKNMPKHLAGYYLLNSYVYPQYIIIIHKKIPVENQVQPGDNPRGLLPVNSN